MGARPCRPPNRTRRVPRGLANAIEISVRKRPARARGALGETACFQPDGGDGDGYAAHRRLECGEPKNGSSNLIGALKQAFN